MTGKAAKNEKSRKATSLAVLAKKAAAARDRAYCPYSNHPVGVAIVTDKGDVFTGANVEIAHYKGVCAEASAISAMITAGQRRIETVVVVGPSMEYLCTPCGDCRQRLREFCAPDVVIHSMWKDGRLGASVLMKDLLPLGFGPENLQEVGTLPARKAAAGASAGGKQAKERVNKKIKKNEKNKPNVSHGPARPRNARSS